jgi:hypothetical protein
MKSGLDELNPVEALIDIIVFAERKYCSSSATSFGAE